MIDIEVTVERFNEAMRKAVEALSEVFEKVLKAVVEFVKYLTKIIRRYALAIHGYKIVNHRGRNKLVKLERKRQ